MASKEEYKIITQAVKAFMTGLPYSGSTMDLPLGVTVADDGWSTLWQGASAIAVLDPRMSPQSLTVLWNEKFAEVLTTIPGLDVRKKLLVEGNRSRQVWHINDEPMLTVDASIQPFADKAPKTMQELQVDMHGKLSKALTDIMGKAPLMMVADADCPLEGSDRMRVILLGACDHQLTGFMLAALEGMVERDREGGMKALEALTVGAVTLRTMLDKDTKLGGEVLAAVHKVTGGREIPKGVAHQIANRMGWDVTNAE